MGSPQRKRHIDELITKLGVTVYYTGEYSFETQTKQINLKSRYDIGLLEGYLSSLHEIGHYCCGHTTPTTWNEEANMELAAWAWAFRHSKEAVPWNVVNRMLGYALLPSLLESQQGKAVEV